MDQISLLNAIELDAEAVVIKSLLEIKVSAVELNGRDFDAEIVAIEREIEEMWIRDMRLWRANQVEISAVELYSIDIDGEGIAVLKVLDVGAIEGFVELKRDGGTVIGGIAVAGLSGDGIKFCLNCIKFKIDLVKLVGFCREGKLSLSELRLKRGNSDLCGLQIRGCFIESLRCLSVIRGGSV